VDLTALSIPAVRANEEREVPTAQVYFGFRRVIPTEKGRASKFWSHGEQTGEHQKERIKWSALEYPNAGGRRVVVEWKELLMTIGNNYRQENRVRQKLCSGMEKKRSGKGKELLSPTSRSSPSMSQKKGPQELPVGPFPCRPSRSASPNESQEDP